MPTPTRLLFVCLGNICRSPMAEGIFLHLAAERGVLGRFVVDSAGTGDWHAGSRPDSRALATVKRHGISLPSLARQVRASDWEDFDLILAMDCSNHDDLIELGAQNVKLMRSYEPDNTNNLDVPDPYYGSGDGFERVYTMLVSACNGLLDELC